MSIYTWVHLHNKGSRGKGLNYNCTTADLVKITTSGSQYRHSHAFTGFRSGPANCSLLLRACHPTMKIPPPNLIAVSHPS